MANNIITIINDQRDTFLRVVSEPSIEFDREAAFAIQILEGNSYLTGIAINNPNSLKNAITNVAAIGISLNPASKLAYLVPRDGKVCLDISYMGMMHLAQQCGAIQWGQSIIVRETDQFELRGIAQEPIHKYKPFDKERGGAVGVYVVVKTDGGDFLTHTMSIEEVFAIRDRSAAWKAWISKKAKCPWVTDEAEMIKKTCVKQSAKYWPRRDRLDQAVHHMNTDGGEGLAQEKDVTPISDDQATAITALLNDMKKTWPELFSALSALFKRTVSSVEELSQEEAAKAIAFMKLKSEKKQ